MTFASSRRHLITAAELLERTASAVVPDADGNHWFTAVSLESALEDHAGDGADHAADADWIEMADPRLGLAVAAWLRYTAARAPGSHHARAVADVVVRAGVPA